MNDIERTVGDINKVWMAGFRAGVEAAAKEAEAYGERHENTHGAAYLSGIAIADCIRSLLNESGAGEKGKT